MTQPLAYLNGRLLPAADLTLSVFDLGFLFGATVSERLRTFGGRLFRLDEHMQRLARSLEIAGLDQQVDLRKLAGIAEQLVEANHPLLPAGNDLGLTLFVTPGVDDGSPERASTVCLHTTPLRFDEWARLYEHGQALATTDIRQTPTECWPPELKCRSRMHYYLADRQARLKQPGARALLLDAQGFVNEASTANVVVYLPDEGLVSPPLERILPGISLDVTFELAGQLGIRCTHRPLDLPEVTAAGEVVLTSTSPCIVPVVSLNGRPIGDGAPGPVFKRLVTAWSKHVGLDIVGQAHAYSQRM